MSEDGFLPPLSVNDPSLLVLEPTNYPTGVLRGVYVVDIKTVNLRTCFCFLLCERELPAGEFRCLQQDGVIAIRAVSTFDTSTGEKFRAWIKGKLMLNLFAFSAV